MADDHSVRPGVLADAESLVVDGQRREDYGGPKESFTRIARLWSATLGVEVSEYQVALCMIQLKIARYVNGAQRDSIVDVAGYARCLDLIHREDQDPDWI